MAAHNVGSGQAQTLEGIAAVLNGIAPKDAEFEAKFARARVSVARLAKYYLRALELHAAGESDAASVPSEDAIIVNLEHVLPKTPSAGWNVHPDIAERMQKRLDNMVLLHAKKNVLAGNKTFNEKVTISRHSPFITTRDVGNV